MFSEKQILVFDTEHIPLKSDHHCLSILRLLHRNDAKIAKICNFWTLWPVIQPINHLFKIRQKALEHWAKRFFVGFWKDCLLAKLQARTSRGWRFWLFQHHSYEVTLRPNGYLSKIPLDLQWLCLGLRNNFFLKSVSWDHLAHWWLLCCHF